MVLMVSGGASACAAGASEAVAFSGLAALGSPSSVADLSSGSAAAARAVRSSTLESSAPPMHNERRMEPRTFPLAGKACRLFMGRTTPSAQRGPLLLVRRVDRREG